jgi:hypothetical protein
MERRTVYASVPNWNRVRRDCRVEQSMQAFKIRTQHTRAAGRVEQSSTQF